MIDRQSLATVLLALAVGLHASFAAAGEPEPSINVSGEGEAGVAPDMAIVSLTVTREGKTAREALSANNRAMEEVLAAMRKRGIEDRDLQTSNFNIQPRYTQVTRTASGERPAPRIDGYTVRNGLTVRVRKLADLGEILDQSVSLGVNEGGGVQFTNADPSKAIEEARVSAVKDAMARAQTLAGAAGVKTGRILSLSEQSYMPRPAPMMRAASFAEAASDSVPMAAGENSYRVNVQLSVAIEQ
jgi:uncharacterized protein YggE